MALRTRSALHLLAGPLRVQRCSRVARTCSMNVSSFFPTARKASTTSYSTSGITIAKFGEISYIEKVLPPLPETHVLVEVASAAVNPADTYMCQGCYGFQPEPPFTPGMEGAGRVMEVGSRVSHLAKGDPVMFSITAADGGIKACTGTWAHHCLIQANLAVRVPSTVDLTSAAAIPVAYLTAHRALFQVARAKATDKVLVRGASGAVGLAAVHLARHFGSSDRLVVGTAGSEEGREAVRRRGGTPTGHAEDQIRKVGDNASFDVIVELMANENLGSDLQLVAPGGRIAAIGSRPGAKPVEVDARLTLVKEATIQGVFLWKQTEEERKAAYNDIFDAFSSKDAVAPAIRRFSLQDASQAHDIVSAQAQGKAKSQGKVVLVSDGQPLRSPL